MTDNAISKIDGWLSEILADPITKMQKRIDEFPRVKGVVDARVYLRNTFGFSDWVHGQDEYEAWATEVCPRTLLAAELEGIEGVRPVYIRFPISGRVLDVGGGAGRLREFLPADAQYVSTDPWPHALEATGPAEKEAYKCLNSPCNFISALAEFQPFIASSFDWVHMRSMLDHVQVPDLALKEAWRVLRDGGNLLVGLYVEGGKSGIIPKSRRIKDGIKKILSSIRIDRFKDHHTWHPTYEGLTKLISENDFTIVDTYWQPCQRDTVCYVKAVKRVT